MEVEGASRHKFTVCIYELLGTAFLAYAVLVSIGNSIAVGFTVFVIILILGPITGAHMNPAVSIGVYVSRQKFGGDFVFFLLIVLSQCLGGYLGMLMAMGSLYVVDHNIPTAWVPTLCPINTGSLPSLYPCDYDENRHFQVFLTQMICTFLFVLEILVIKGRYTAPTQDGMLGALAVGLGLFAIINLDTIEGPCFNPAIGLVQTTYQNYYIDIPGDSKNSLTKYLWAYTLGPAAGGLIAGAAHIFHSKTVEMMKHEARHKEEGYDEIDR